MKKRDLIIFRTVTALFSLFMLFQVVMYFIQHEMTSNMFESLGVPTSLVYPLAIAKFLGLFAIWTNYSKLLKNLAYLGYAIDFILAISLHSMVGDGGAPAPGVALLLLIVSYIYGNKINNHTSTA